LQLAWKTGARNRRQFLAPVSGAGFWSVCHQHKILVLNWSQIGLRTSFSPFGLVWFQVMSRTMVLANEKVTQCRIKATTLEAISCEFSAVFTSLRTHPTDNSKNENSNIERLLSFPRTKTTSHTILRVNDTLSITNSTALRKNTFVFALFTFYLTIITLFTRVACDPTTLSHAHHVCLLLLPSWWAGAGACSLKFAINARAVEIG